MDKSSMAAERRASGRTPVSLCAVVYYNTLMLPGCELRDLSPEGAFVHTDGHFLPDQAVVDLAFPQLGEDSAPRRFAAQVVRSNGEGVGVRLLHSDPAELRDLAEALYRIPVSATAGRF